MGLRNTNTGPAYISSLSEILQAERWLDVPYFGNRLRIAYNPGAFDDELMDNLREAENLELRDAITEILQDQVDDVETVTEMVLEAVMNIAGQQAAASYVLDTLRRTLVGIDIKDDQGKQISVEDALSRFPIPLRGAIFAEMTEDMANGRKKSSRTEPKRREPKQPKGSFGATS